MVEARLLRCATWLLFVERSAQPGSEEFSMHVPGFWNKGQEFVLVRAETVRVSFDQKEVLTCVEHGSHRVLQKNSLMSPATPSVHDLLCTPFCFFRFKPTVFGLLFIH